jgi:hypothetical protein
MAEEQQEPQGYQMQSTHTYKVITSYMAETFEQDAIQTSLIAVDKYRQLKDIAFFIKHEVSLMACRSGCSRTVGGGAFGAGAGAGADAVHRLQVLPAAEDAPPHIAVRQEVPRQWEGHGGRVPLHRGQELCKCAGFRGGRIIALPRDTAPPYPHRIASAWPAALSSAQTGVCPLCCGLV